jgi:hypothetical protein
MLDKNEEYVEFTKICGDCGKRFKEKFRIPVFKTTKDRNKFAQLYLIKYNLCCRKCAETTE